MYQKKRKLEHTPSPVTSSPPSPTCQNYPVSHFTPIAPPPSINISQAQPSIISFAPAPSVSTSPPETIYDPISSNISSLHSNHRPYPNFTCSASISEQNRKFDNIQIIYNENLLKPCKICNKDIEMGIIDNITQLNQNNNYKQFLLTIHTGTIFFPWMIHSTHGNFCSNCIPHLYQ